MPSKELEIGKTVYFVRHGQSEDNARPVFQSQHSPLNERGKEQAEKIAERAARLEFDHLISSPYLRARETAEAISRVTGKVPEFSDLFVERIKPSAIEGKLYDDTEAKELNEKWRETHFAKGLKVEDGENYEEIVARADKALEFLEDHEGENLVVVTHGLFFRTMMLRVILGDSMTEANLKSFQHAATMKNTGLSVLQYSKWQEEKPKWCLWIYNDHSHLG